MQQIRENRTATLRVTAQEIHIYPFSKLVGALPPRWERLLSEIEEKEQLIYRYYQPVREAAVRLAAQGLHRRDAIFAEMRQRAAEVMHGPRQKPIEDNQARFAVFENSFLPKIKEFKASLLRVPQVHGTPFAGLILKGLPHMVVVDNRGRDRYVYLYPSSWDDADRDAYLELLTIIIESQFNASAADLWCMGLKDGKTVPWPKSKIRVRNACYDAARHYRRLMEK